MDTLLLLALINFGSAMADGYTTLMPTYDCFGNEFHVPEGNPIARAFIGEYPTWESMTKAGAIEIASLTAFSYILKRAHIRKWWVPQISISTLHLSATGYNIYIRKTW